MTANQEIRLTALGDVAVVGAFRERFLHAPLAEVVDPGIVALLGGADACLANIECVLTDSKNFAVPGYGLRCPPAVAGRLCDLGISIAGLANNHIRDVGCEGVNDTVAHLRAAGIAVCGAGANLQEATRPLVFSVRGIRVGILAVAEREYNLATPEQAGAAPFEPCLWQSEIRELRAACDVALVFVHAGHEFASVPSPRIRAAYRGAVEAGAHAVIAHHPHVIQGIEVYRGAPIFYSLGNFCFDSSYVAGYEGWDRAFVAELRISRRGVQDHAVHPIRIEQGRSVRMMRGAERDDFLAELGRLSRLLEEDEPRAGWRQAWEDHVRWRAERDYLPNLDRFEARLAEGKEPNLARILRNYFQCPTHQELLDAYFAQRAARGKSDLIR